MEGSRTGEFSLHDSLQWNRSASASTQVEVVAAALPSSAGTASPGPAVSYQLEHTKYTALSHDISW